MDLVTLASELSTDPLGRSYSSMSDAAAAADLNTAYRSANRSTMTASEVLNAFDYSEWSALTADQKQLVWNVLHLGELNPFGVEATVLVAVFGAGSDTISALAAARVQSITRAAELGLGTVRAGDVQRARA